MSNFFRHSNEPMSEWRARTPPTRPMGIQTSRLRQVVKVLAFRGVEFAFRCVDRRLGRDTIVVYYLWPDFARKAEGLAATLRMLGFKAVVRTGGSLWDRIRVKSSPHLHIGFWNTFQMPFLPARYIFFNAEPLNLPHWKNDREWFEAMRGALQVWGYFAPHERFVTPLGVPYRYVPFGYSTVYEAMYKAGLAGTVPDKDIDALFIGGMYPRRELVLDRMRAAGIMVHAVTRANPAHGAALDALIARSKVVLSIHGFDDPEAQYVDYARLDYLLANGCFVLHEVPSPELRDVEFEQHVAIAAFDQLCERCAHFLELPEERISRAAASHRWYRNAMAMDKFIPAAELRRLLETE